MKSLIAFSHYVLHDLGDRCCISTSRDIETVTARVEHEGLSFLTITLPNFAKDLQKGLEQGFVDHAMFPGFRRHRGLPRFLGGFLDHVFNRETGRLLDEPSIEAIYSLRQFCMLFGKIELQCSDERRSKAFQKYIECEQELRESDTRWHSSKELDDFRRVSLMLFGEIFSKVDQLVYNGEIMPKHGPGATAERLSANSRYSLWEWTERLEHSFDFSQMIFPNPGWYHTFQDTKVLEPGAETPVRVISVPKTLETPRIIAIEPAVMQYMQQGILETMRAQVYGDDILYNLIGDEYQEPNRLLARQGSIDGTLATLDLSEASDRVSNQLVRELFDRWPSLHGAVDATRSRKADVPGFGVIRLAKFASMGSAMCFMVEELVFCTIVFMAMERSLSRRLTERDIKSSIGRVRIYGDDIIVPVDMVPHVVDLLETFGLKVNRNKSFWNGKFRESCGGDYYNGKDVTPVRVRALFPTRRADSQQIASTVALRNLLFEKGFESAVSFLDSKLKKLLPNYREVPRDSPALGRWTHEPIKADGISTQLHRPFIKAPVLVNRIPSDTLDGRGALMKYFLKRSELPFADEKHLERSGRPVSVDIKIRRIYL